MLSDLTIPKSPCLGCGEPVPPTTQRRLYCSHECEKAYVRTNKPRRGRGDRLPTPTIGAAHELLVAADLLRRGYHVFRALSAACPADLVAYKGDCGDTLRIEVRTALARRDGSLYANRNAGPRDRRDVMAHVSHAGRIEYTPEIE
jgi:predicted nucleic acid-binding Zn ribbon protein